MAVFPPRFSLFPSHLSAAKACTGPPLPLTPEFRGFFWSSLGLSDEGEVARFYACFFRGVYRGDLEPFPSDSEVGYFR